MPIRTSYQGLEVVDFESTVLARHPRWGHDPEKMAPLKGASLLFLSDGSLVVVCDECDFNGVTGHNPYVKPDVERPIVEQADSVMPHINAKHNPSRNGDGSTKYTDGQIRAAIKIWLKWKGSHRLGWVQEACDELEAIGFRPWHGGHWMRDQLGSLMRSSMRKERFKNIEAGPMTNADRESLAALVREIAIREGKDPATVAGNARITETKNPPHKHTPVDFAKIIASKGAGATPAEKKEDTSVPAKTPVPTLSFGNGADPAPVKTIVVDSSQPTVVNPGLHKRPEEVVVAAPVESDFRLLTVLDDGTPMFTYKGSLMVGKKVKGVQV